MIILCEIIAPHGSIATHSFDVVVDATSVSMADIGNKLDSIDSSGQTSVSETLSEINSLYATLSAIPDAAQTASGTDSATDAKEVAQEQQKQRAKIFNVLSNVLDNTENLTSDQADSFLSSVRAVASVSSSGPDDKTTSNAGPAISLDTAVEAAGMLVKLAKDVSASQSGTMMSAAADIMQSAAAGSPARSNGASRGSQNQTALAAKQQTAVTSVVSAIEAYSQQILPDPEDYTEPIKATSADGKLTTTAGWAPALSNSSANHRPRRSAKAHALVVTNGPYSFHIPAQWFSSERLSERLSYTSLQHQSSPYSYTDKALMDAVGSLTLYTQSTRRRRSKNERSVAPIAAQPKCMRLQRQSTFAPRPLDVTRASPSETKVLEFRRKGADAQKTLHIIVEPFLEGGASLLEMLDVRVGTTDFITDTTAVHEFAFRPRAVRAQTEAESDQASETADSSHVLQIVPQHLSASVCRDANSVTHRSPSNSGSGEVLYTIAVKAVGENSSAFNFSLRIMQYECLFLDEETNSWRGENCTVSPLSSPGRMLCDCNHLTVSGGSSLPC